MAITHLYIADPELMQFQQWASSMVGASNGGLLPGLTDDWRQWGASLAALSQITAINVPNPYKFNDWREWARELIKTMSTAGA